MRGYREPASVLSCPAVGIASRGGLSVRQRIAGAGVDDGEVAQDANLDVLRLEIFDGERHGGLLKKSGAVDQRLVGIGTVEISGKDFIETLHIAILHRGD